LALIPPVSQEPAPIPDQYTEVEEEDTEIAKAITLSKLKQKERLEFELGRHWGRIESDLGREREQRENLQQRVDELGPKCKSLEAMHTLDTGITTWASCGSLIGNTMVAVASFWGAQAGMMPLLVAGLVITVISSFFIFGVHKWWIPKIN